MVNKGVLFMFGNTQIKLLVLLITNLELWNSWSNFDIYFQMIAKGQTRRTQTTTNTAWHFASMFKAPVKMSASGPNIMQHITANGYSYISRTTFERKWPLNCEKNIPSPQYCNDYCSKSWYALCVNNFLGRLHCTSMHVLSNMLFSEIQEYSCVLIENIRCK